MPTFPLRKWGQTGIVRDVAPFDLPPTGWSGGRNVVFLSGVARRSAAFRTLQDLNASVPTPTSVVSYRPSSGNDKIFAVSDDGSVFQYTAGSGMTNVTGTFTPSTAVSQYTAGTLSGVLYINRESHVPRYLLNATGLVEDLPNWPSTYRAQIIRPYKDFLFAFGITKGASVYASTFKWSNATLAGAIPNSWDETVIANNLAGETTLAEMDSAIMDACQLRDDMIVYGRNQVWSISYTSDKTFPFAQRKVFSDGGAIGRNCAVEVNGTHYVFGSDDIYMHDGVNKKSISAGRVRMDVFSQMNRLKASRFFVAHDPVNRLLMFCYVSTDSTCSFPSTANCNRAAVYSYGDDAWGTMELPNVCAMTVANTSLVPTWSAATSTWLDVGGTWGDLEDGQKQNLISVCASTGAVTSPRLHALDGVDMNTRVSAPLDSQANILAYLERVGLDLDDLGAAMSDFKTVDSMRPQIRTSRSVSLSVQLGATTFQQIDPTYETALTFDPTLDQQVHARASGRYLAIKISATEEHDFELTGADVEVQTNGSR